MLDLKRSTDRKTANLASPNGKTAKIKNAFGLPAGSNKSCPGMTGVCEKICYANKLEKLFPGFRNAMEHNWEQVKDASFDQLVEALNHIIGEFETDCDKWGAEKYFRIHHDGDFFSEVYAQSWAEVIKSRPDTQFWVYTRSFVDKLNIVPIIAGIDNLSVYLSVDEDNQSDAADVLSAHKDIKIAYLAETFAEAGDAIRDITGSNKPGAKCPELTKSIPLIDKNGGACFSCKLCPDSKADIRFAITKK